MAFVCNGFAIRPKGSIRQRKQLAKKLNCGVTGEHPNDTKTTVANKRFYYLIIVVESFNRRSAIYGVDVWFIERSGCIVLNYYRLL
jgi:hypothetical protein